MLLGFVEGWKGGPRFVLRAKKNWDTNDDEIGSNGNLKRIRRDSLVIF